MDVCTERNNEITDLFADTVCFCALKVNRDCCSRGLSSKCCCISRDLILDQSKRFFLAMTSHPNIVVQKKSNSPDEDKSVHDSKLLIPTLKDFFSKHPLINPKTFLGDAAFDTAQLYKSLLVGDIFGDDKHFSKAYIPLNARAGLENQDYSINKNGIPCCPHDPSLPMKYECTSKLRSGVTRFKFVCPKMKYVYDKNTKKVHRQCCCENPCTTSRCGRMVYIYPEKDLRAYPRTIRGTEEWDNTYKIRTAVERDINHIKDNLCLAGRRTQNEKTLHADLILAGITQLITVVLAKSFDIPTCPLINWLNVSTVVPILVANSA